MHFPVPQANLAARDVLLKNRSSPASGKKAELDKGQVTVQSRLLLNKSTDLGFTASYGL
jgi:hypothetical protein